MYILIWFKNFWWSREVLSWRICQQFQAKLRSSFILISVVSSRECFCELNSLTLTGDRRWEGWWGVSRSRWSSHRDYKQLLSKYGQHSYLRTGNGIKATKGSTKNGNTTATTATRGRRRRAERKEKPATASVSLENKKRTQPCAEEGCNISFALAAATASVDLSSGRGSAADACAGFGISWCCCCCSCCCC